MTRLLKALLCAVLLLGSGPAFASGFSSPQPVVALCQSAVATAVTGTASETTQATCTIPAGLIGANGQVEVEVLQTFTNNANNKTVRIKLGGSTIYSTAIASTLTAQIRKRIANRNSQSSQISTAAGVAVELGISGLGTVATYTENTAAAVNLLITCQLATTTDTCQLESYRVLIYPKS